MGAKIEGAFLVAGRTSEDPVRPERGGIMGAGEGEEPVGESAEVPKEVRRVRTPAKPSAEEVREHLDCGHIPFRDWCDICVEGRAVNPGHFHQKREGQEKQKKYLKTYSLHWTSR